MPRPTEGNLAMFNIINAKLNRVNGTTDQNHPPPMPAASVNALVDAMMVCLQGIYYATRLIRVPNQGHLPNTDVLKPRLYTLLSCMREHNIAELPPEIWYIILFYVDTCKVIQGGCEDTPAHLLVTRNPTNIVTGTADVPFHASQAPTGTNYKDHKGRVKNGYNDCVLATLPRNVTVKSPGTYLTSIASVVNHVFTCPDKTLAIRVVVSLSTERASEKTLCLLNLVSHHPSMKLADTTALWVVQVQVTMTLSYNRKRKRSDDVNPNHNDKDICKRHVHWVASSTFKRGTTGANVHTVPLPYRQALNHALAPNWWADMFGSGRVVSMYSGVVTGRDWKSSPYGDLKAGQYKLMSMAMLDMFKGTDKFKEIVNVLASTREEKAVRAVIQKKTLLVAKLGNLCARGLNSHEPGKMGNCNRAFSTAELRKELGLPLWQPSQPRRWHPRRSPAAHVPLARAPPQTPDEMDPYGRPAIQRVTRPVCPLIYWPYEAKHSMSSLDDLYNNCRFFPDDRC